MMNAHSDALRGSLALPLSRRRDAGCFFLKPPSAGHSAILQRRRLASPSVRGGNDVQANAKVVHVAHFPQAHSMPPPVSPSEHLCFVPPPPSPHQLSTLPSLYQGTAYLQEYLRELSLLPPGRGGRETLALCIVIHIYTYTHTHTHNRLSILKHALFSLSLFSVTFWIVCWVTSPLPLGRAEAKATDMVEGAGCCCCN